MNIAYFGSPTISARLLSLLLEHKNPSDKLVYVFTQPDRPAGKRLELTSTPVKQIAQIHCIPVFDKRLKNSQEEASQIMKSQQIELSIVFAYGEIIPKDILSLPAHGYFNVHPSNLPIYRGPSPLAYTLILGDPKTAVSMMLLTPKMDEGPVIMKEEIILTEDMTREELEELIPVTAFRLLEKTLKDLKAKQISYTDQIHNHATYTRMIQKNDGYIPLEHIKKGLKNEPFTEDELPVIIKEYISKFGPTNITAHFTSGQIIYNLYRGLYGWPGIWTKITTPQGEKRLIITKLSYKEKLRIEQIQLEGKNITEFETFNRAYSIFS